MQDTQDHDENGKPLNAFGELLRVSDIELLIRFRHRLQKKGKKRMVQILTDEIEEREDLERKEIARLQEAIDEEVKELEELEK